MGRMQRFWRHGKYVILLGATVLLCWNFSLIASWFLVPNDTLFADAMSAEDDRLMNAALREFSETLDKANVTYFMMEGTLLGSYRHHGRIPWDDDIDLIVGRTDQEKLTQLFNDSASHIFMNAYASESEHWKFFPKNGHPIAGHPFRSPYIDVFWFEQNSSHVSYTSPMFPTRIPKSLVFPLRRRPFGKFFLPSPCNPRDYLAAAKYEPDRCESSGSSHITAKARPLVRTVNCRRLAHIHPFVERRQHNVGNGQIVVIEELTVKGAVIRQWSYEDHPGRCIINKTL